MTLRTFEDGYRKADVRYHFNEMASDELLDWIAGPMTFDEFIELAQSQDADGLTPSAALGWSLKFLELAARSAGLAKKKALAKKLEANIAKLREAAKLLPPADRG